MATLSVKQEPTLTPVVRTFLQKNDFKKVTEAFERFKNDKQPLIQQSARLIQSRVGNADTPEDLIKHASIAQVQSRISEAKRLLASAKVAMRQCDHDVYVRYYLYHQMSLVYEKLGAEHDTGISDCQNAQERILKNLLLPQDITDKVECLEILTTYATTLFHRYLLNEVYPHVQPLANAELFLKARFYIGWATVDTDDDQREIKLQHVEETLSSAASAEQTQIRLWLDLYEKAKNIPFADKTRSRNWSLDAIEQQYRDKLTPLPLAASVPKPSFSPLPISSSSHHTKSTIARRVAPYLFGLLALAFVAIMARRYQFSVWTWGR